MTKTIEKLVDRVTDLESKMSDLRHNDLESVTEMNK
jgi:cell division protein FtsB